MFQPLSALNMSTILSYLINHITTATRKVIVTTFQVRNNKFFNIDVHGFYDLALLHFVERYTITISALPHTQLSNVMYVGLSMMCLLTLALLALFYMRSLKDKRRSQAAIRSLLDLMTESQRGESQTSPCGIGAGHPISSFVINPSGYFSSSGGCAEDSNFQRR